MAFDKSLDGEATQIALPGLVSLGGCVVGHLAATMNGRAVRHTRHMWRRPTIAMMSQPVSRFRFDFTKVPAGYANYLVNDAGGAHREEIMAPNAPEERVFVFDVTRDVITGVVEIEPDVWIMDPIDAVYLVESLKPDTMTEEVLQHFCKGNARRMSAVHHWDEFFPRWQKAFRAFAAIIEGRFDKVIVAEIYPTRARLDSSNPFFAPNVEEMNDRLEIIYAWLKEHYDFEWIGVPRERSVTGVTGLPFNGPTPTHFVQESHTLMAGHFISKINSMRNPNAPLIDASSPLVEQAFERAKQHEQALEEIKALKARLANAESLGSAFEAREKAYENQLAELKAGSTRLAAQKDEVLQRETGWARRVNEMTASLSILESERDQLLKRVVGLQLELETLKQAQVRQTETRPVSLGAMIKRTIARKTRRLRGISA
ncbi:DUF6270 domain-containing protein [Brevundimonas sp. UBA5866]|uniref:DUF6270 domain-containing protein n=1 Tax=Brevundimonas sp. UBA5866 TaxID=1946132 RepID=UPI0025BC3344|nr:DUF6270 domain-containing protein [Brevundimonas sp. UBA5866]